MTDSERVLLRRADLAAYRHAERSRYLRLFFLGFGIALIFAAMLLAVLFL